MPRPRNQELPANLLKAARELLVEHEGPTFSMRELAARVGYALTAVYRCYENRAALLRALMLELFAEFNQHCVPSMNDGAVSALRSAGERFVEWAFAHRTEYLFMFSEYGPDSLLADEAEARVARAGLDGIIFLLSAAQSTGAIDIEDPEAAAIQLLAQLHGLVSLSLTGRLQGTPAENAVEFQRRFGAAFFDRLLGL